MELNLKMLQAEQAEEERERLQLRRAESRELTLQRNPSKNYLHSTRKSIHALQRR